MVRTPKKLTVVLEDGTDETELTVQTPVAWGPLGIAIPGEVAGEDAACTIVTGLAGSTLEDGESPLDTWSGIDTEDDLAAQALTDRISVSSAKLFGGEHTTDHFVSSDSVLPTGIVITDTSAGIVITDTSAGFWSGLDEAVSLSIVITDTSAG